MGESQAAGESDRSRIKYKFILNWRSAFGRHGLSPMDSPFRNSRVEHSLRLACLVLLLAVGLFAGCERRQPEGGEEAVKTHAMRGVVRGELTDGKISIEHEDVEGFMPSMTMPFQPHNPSQAAGLKVGDGVEFTLSLEKSGPVIHGLRAVDPGTVKLPGIRAGTSDAAPKRLKEGDEWPEFALVNQEGRTLTRKDFSGRYTLVTFMFARCAVSTFCPMMTRKFSEIANAVAQDSGLAGRVGLLSISFDPADTPEVLTEYWSSQAGKNPHWFFATGEPSEIDKLARAFSVRIESSKGTYDHTLCTALIDPRGRVLQLWRGNGWKPEEVVAALHGFLNASDSPSALKPNQPENPQTKS